MMHHNFTWICYFKIIQSIQLTSYNNTKTANYLSSNKQPTPHILISNTKNDVLIAGFVELKVDFVVAAQCFVLTVEQKVLAVKIAMVWVIVVLFTLQFV